MHKDKVWVVVANGSQAKIFRAENVKKLVEIRDLAHLESRLTNAELVSDRYGKSTQAEPHGMASHGIPQRTSPKEREKNYFAEEIGLILNDHILKGDFEKLYIVAPAHFCKFLHDHFNAAVKKSIAQEVHKDLLHQSHEEICDHLTLSF